MTYVCRKCLIQHKLGLWITSSLRKKYPQMYQSYAYKLITKSLSNYYCNAYDLVVLLLWSAQKASNTNIHCSCALHAIAVTLVGGGANILAVCTSTSKMISIQNIYRPTAFLAFVACRYIAMPVIKMSPSSKPVSNG